MSYQQDIARWSASGELYRSSRMGVEVQEAAYEAREMARINGGMRVAESILDGVYSLQHVAAAKVASAPEMAYVASRVLSTIEMACCERLARYMLA